VEACKAHGKFAGIGGIYDDALLRRYIGMGVRLVIGGNDLGLMMSAASASGGLHSRFARARF
ncbi:MAG: hypothetical protein ACREFH_13180, partial [Stellaceae bacterium]